MAFKHKPEGWAGLGWLMKSNDSSSTSVLKYYVPAQGKSKGFSLTLEGPPHLSPATFQLVIPLLLIRTLALLTKPCLVPSPFLCPYPRMPIPIPILPEAFPRWIQISPTLVGPPSCPSAQGHLPPSRAEGFWSIPLIQLWWYTWDSQAYMASSQGNGRKGRSLPYFFTWTTHRHLKSNLLKA